MPTARWSTPRSESSACSRCPVHGGPTPLQGGCGLEHAQAGCQQAAHHVPSHDCATMHHSQSLRATGSAAAATGNNLHHASAPPHSAQPPPPGPPVTGAAAPPSSTACTPWTSTSPPTTAPTAPPSPSSGCAASSPSAVGRQSRRCTSPSPCRRCARQGVRQRGWHSFLLPCCRRAVPPWWQSACLGLGDGWLMRGCTGMMRLLGGAGHAPTASAVYLCQCSQPR